MGIVLGLDAKLYIDDADNYAAPSWSEVCNVKDLTLNLETAEADVTTRCSNGWRGTVATIKDGTIEFQMVWDTADANFQVLKDAFLNNDAINVAAMDGDITTPGSEGLRAVMMVSNFSRTENLEEALMVDVTLKITYFPDDAPEWLVVGA